MKNIAEDIVLQTNAEIVNQTGVTKRTYEMIYKGNPPWEINQVQPFLERIEKEDDFRSSVLDIGCGFGTNAKFLATKGYVVTAIDYLDDVIQKAINMNAHPNICYEVQDIFEYDQALTNYTTLIDSATFHGFSDDERKTYVKLMQTHLRPGSHLYIIGFSDRENQNGGPRRLSETMFRQYFQEGFVITDIFYTDYHTNIFDGSINAIMVKVKKI